MLYVMKYPTINLIMPNKINCWILVQELGYFQFQKKKKESQDINGNKNHIFLINTKSSYNQQCNTIYCYYIYP